MPKKEKKLKDYINGDLKIQIEEIWRKAKKSYHQTQKGDTIQGSVHCNNVEKNILEIIRKSNQLKNFKQIELFILSAAACMHDISKSREKKILETDHGVISQDIVIKEYAQLGLDRPQCNAVAIIVGVHNNLQLGNITNQSLKIGTESIDILKLAVIFCLADILETSNERAPDILNYIIFDENKIPSKWLARQAISGWDLENKTRKILLQAIPKDEEELESILILKVMMREELSKISSFLTHFGFPSEIDLEIQDLPIKKSLSSKGKKLKSIPGMGYYSLDYAEIFKGRDDEISKLLANVTFWPISLLIGESGSGKTSLIQAGLFPKLDALSWKYVWTRPFNDPENDIKRVIWYHFFQEKFDPVYDLLDVIKKAAEKSKPKPLIIVIDQFEDILKIKSQKTFDVLSQILSAIQCRAIIPNVRVLLSVRDDSVLKLNSRLLKRVHGSASQFPSLELEGLTREGAKIAFLALISNTEFMLDEWALKRDKRLLDAIIDDILNGSDRIYPPYIQMVMETLSRKVDKKNPVITEYLYFEELKSTRNIVARYLFEQLNEFGHHKNIAAKILISLTSSFGTKNQKSIEEISIETKIDADEIRIMITEMIDHRMVRSLDNDLYEIVHDYLATLVNTELIIEEERNLKFIDEQLSSYLQNFKVFKTPIFSLPFLVNLYKNRDRIKIDDEMIPLFLSTCLLKQGGLGWFFLKKVRREKICESLKKLWSHEIADIKNNSKIKYLHFSTSNEEVGIKQLLTNDNLEIRKAAAAAYLRLDVCDIEILKNLLNDHNTEIRELVKKSNKLPKFDDLETIFKMIDVDDDDITQIASNALFKLATNDNKQYIKERLFHPNKKVCLYALKSFRTLVSLDDKDLILKLMHDTDHRVREAAITVFGEIATDNDKELLRKFFSDNSSRVQVAAIRIFSYFVSLEDKEIIYNLLCDKSKEVRLAAFKIIEKIIDSNDLFAIVRCPQYVGTQLIFKLYIDKDENIQKLSEELWMKIATSDNRLRVQNETLEDEGSYSFLQSSPMIHAMVKRMLVPLDKKSLDELIWDTNYQYRTSAIEIFIKNATYEDLPSILKLSDIEKSELALEKLSELVKYEDIQILRNLIKKGFRNEKIFLKFLDFASIEDKELVISFINSTRKGQSISFIVQEKCLRFFDQSDKKIFFSLINEHNENNDYLSLKVLEKFASLEDSKFIIELLMKRGADIIDEETMRDYGDEHHIIVDLDQAYLNWEVLLRISEKIALVESLFYCITIVQNTNTHLELRHLAVQYIVNNATLNEIDKLIELLNTDDNWLQNLLVHKLQQIGDNRLNEICDILIAKARGWDIEQRRYFNALSIFDELLFCNVCEK